MIFKKKIFMLIPFFGLALFFLLSCKKHQINPPKLTQKKLSDSIVNRAWWGQLTYIGKNSEYYIIHFNSDSTFLFSQLSGDYSGKYSISSNVVTMRPDANSVTIKAIFTGDQFTAITDDTPVYQFNSGQLVPKPDLSLVNSSWKGNSITDPFAPTVAPIPRLLNIDFKLNSAMIFMGINPVNSQFTTSAIFSPNSYGDSFRFKFIGPTLTNVYMFGVKINEKLVKGDVISDYITTFILSK